MRRNPLEWMGAMLSWPLGLLTAAVSLIRRARVFHPKGLVFEAIVQGLAEDELKLHPYALLRFSGGWWKNKEWKDVLGVAIRFSSNPRFHSGARESDQDLLLATFDRVWKLPFGPLLTHQHDYLANEYYAVLPFSTCSWKSVRFKLVPESPSPAGEKRESRIREAIRSGGARLTLMARANGPEWMPVAQITLVSELQLDQEALRFDPFRAGLGIFPEGPIHHLRIGTYRLSQWARPRQSQNLRAVQFTRRTVAGE